MYNVINTLHHYNRWLLICSVTFVLASSLTAWLSKNKYSKLDNIAGASAVGFAHLQLILGLILYFGLSPIMQTIFADFGAAMKDSALRFYAVEHILTGVLGVAAIQIGRIRSKRAKTDLQKHKQMFIFTALALVLFLSRMPNYHLTN
jgi:hypothetical protein